MSVKDKLQNASQSVADAAKTAGHKIAEGAEQAADWVKDKTGLGKTDDTGVKERMDVIGSCGMKLGVVDHVKDGSIKLTRKDSPDGEHHFIPMAWVDHVDSHVHLNRDCGEARLGWQSTPTGTSV